MQDKPRCSICFGVGGRVWRLNPQVLPESQEGGNAGKPDPHEDQDWGDSHHSVPANECCELERRGENLVNDDGFGEHQPTNGQDRADASGDRSLQQERQLNVKIARSDQSHDAGFAAPTKRGHSHGVRYEEHGHNQHDNGDNQRNCLESS